MKLLYRYIIIFRHKWIFTMQRDSFEIVSLPPTSCFASNMTFAKRHSLTTWYKDFTVLLLSLYTLNLQHFYLELSCSLICLYVYCLCTHLKVGSIKEGSLKVILTITSLMSSVFHVAVALYIIDKLINCETKLVRCAGIGQSWRGWKEVNFKGEDDSWKHVYQPEKKAALTLTKLGNPVRETGLWSLTSFHILSIGRM